MRSLATNCDTWYAPLVGKSVLFSKLNFGSCHSFATPAATSFLPQAPAHEDGQTGGRPLVMNGAYTFLRWNTRPYLPLVSMREMASQLPEQYGPLFLFMPISQPNFTSAAVISVPFDQRAPFLRLAVQISPVLFGFGSAFRRSGFGLPFWSK